MVENTEYLLPVKIHPIDGCAENTESLLKSKTRQIGLGENDVATIRGKTRIVFDFGKEIQGGVRLLTHYIENGSPVRIRFGESFTESLAPLGVKNATNDHSLRDFSVSLPQLSDGCYGQTGFRFVCLEFGGGTYRLKNVYAKSVTEKREIAGSFRCSDERLNEIYSVAQRTLLLCLQGGMIWDGIKRDRLVWIGDLHPETLGVLYTTADTENVANCIDFGAEETPPTDWMNGYTAYSFWWILVLYDYHRFTGDNAKVGLYIDYLAKLIGNTNKLVSENGEADFPNYFLDWPTSGTADAVIGCNALLKIAAEKGGELLRFFGKDDFAAMEIVRKLASANNAEPVAKQAVAMNYLAGNEDKNAATEKLAAGGAKGLSTFMSYYVLTAAKRCCGAETAVKMLKDYYGGMLDKGATSFWEDFDVEWIKDSGRIDDLPKDGQKDIHGDYGKFCYTGFRHSLCHGWSCGPIAFLTETVLGVHVSDGGKKITVEPSLCGLEFADGSIPTPYGKAEIRVRRAGGETEVEITAPKEVEIVANSCKLTRKGV